MKFYIDNAAILKLGGSFWKDINTNKLFDDIVVARSLLEQQADEDVDLLVACTSRDTIPIGRKILFQPIKLLRSAGKVQKIDPQLVTIPMIVDQITKPTLTLISGSNYAVEKGEIHFDNNLFDTELLRTGILDEEGNEVDQEITLWGINCLKDEYLLADCWGAPFKLEAPSSPEFAELLRIVYDAMLTGTNETLLYRLLRVLYGPQVEFYRGRVPETVQSITLPANALDASVGAAIVFPNETTEFHAEGPAKAVARFYELFRDQIPKGSCNPANYVLGTIMPRALICTIEDRQIVPSLANIDVGQVLRLVVPPQMPLVTAKMR
jgi:hypothetical protein